MKAEPEEGLTALPLPCAKRCRADYVQCSLRGLMEPVIRLVVRIAVLIYIGLAIAQAPITGLHVTTMACQQRVDRR
jgi:hypothetical protein